MSAIPLPLGIIGGSSLLESKIFQDLEVREVSTPYGTAILHFAKNFIFVQRHHADPSVQYSQPHLINFRAIIWALHQSGVKNILAFCSVGSLKTNIPVGRIVLPDDYFCLWDKISFFTDARKQIAELFEKENITFVNSGTYVQTTGPRFETKAEVRYLTTVADIVGMTGAHEATLATELKMDYAVVCMVDNPANGLDIVKLTFENFREGVNQNQQTVELVCALLVKHFTQHQ